MKKEDLKAKALEKSKALAGKGKGFIGEFKELIHIGNEKANVSVAYNSQAICVEIGGDVYGWIFTNPYNGICDINYYKLSLVMCFVHNVD